MKKEKEDMQMDGEKREKERKREGVRKRWKTDRMGEKRGKKSKKIGIKFKWLDTGCACVCLRLCVCMCV